MKTGWVCEGSWCELIPDHVADACRHSMHNDTGISIGHHDTDNLVTGNTVRGSKKHGVLFRPERSGDFTGNRNRIEKNVLVNNGAENRAAIEVQGGTRDLVIAGNEITEKRGEARRAAIRVGAATENIQ